MTQPQPALTVTFSECVENHVGMQQIGQIAEHGFTREQLIRIHQTALRTELYDLAHTLPAEHRAASPAYLMVIRDGVRQLGVDPDALFAEISAVPHDPQMYSAKHGGVVNKRARHNLCVADVEQAPDIAQKKGTVVPYTQLPEMSKLREGIGRYLGAAGLYAETNLYYDPAKCGIGYHGDTERKIVVGARLGAPIPLTYRWYWRGQPISRVVPFDLRHGDMYVMSDKAAGGDWKRSSIPTLRHAAGAPKYTDLEK